MVIRLNGHITDKGELKLDLPADLPAGEVQITIETSSDVQLPPKKATQTLTAARRVAWRVPDTSPDPVHSRVIFKKVGTGGVELYKTLRPGQVFKRPLFTSADSFETYAISTDQDLRHEFSRKYLSGDQTWSFTLHFKLHFRVKDAEYLGLSLARDPLERLQEEVASVLSATARRFSWESMKREAEGFGLQLREAETTDGRGESRTNFRRLQDFASSLGLELRHIDILCSLIEPDLQTELRVNEHQRAIVRSDQELATERKQLNHELQELKDQHRIERETAIVRSSSQALQEMERLRLILDAVVQGGVQSIHQSAGELRSFDAIHRALIEIQGIQATLAGLPGGAVYALASGGYKDGSKASDSGGLLEDLDRALQTTPMTGADIVKAGLVGGWENAEIEDSARWVEEQRQARRERRQR
jgi:hypothetical protein